MEGPPKKSIQPPSKSWQTSIRPQKVGRATNEETEASLDHVVEYFERTGLI